MFPVLTADEIIEKIKKATTKKVLVVTSSKFDNATMMKIFRKSGAQEMDDVGHGFLIKK